MIKYKIKTGDKVVVTAGTDKGKEGTVLKLIREKQRVLVEGVNIIKKHVKPSAQNPQGGIQEMEAPIHISNVMLVDPKTGNGTRIGFKMENGTKVRIAKKSGQEV